MKADDRYLLNKSLKVKADCVCPICGQHFTDYIKSYDDCKYFYQLCRESLEHYKSILPKQPEYSWSY